MTSTSSDTRYVVARGTNTVGPSFSKVEDAKGYLTSVQEQLTSLGVTADDVHVATIETTTTISDPVEYVEPEPVDEAVPEQVPANTLPADEGGDVDDHDATSSVQGSDDADTTPAS